MVVSSFGLSKLLLQSFVSPILPPMVNPGCRSVDPIWWVRDQFAGRICPARCCFLAVALLGGYLFLLVDELWLFRHGGNGCVRLFYCLLVLVAVGWLWWAAWVSPPWLMSIWGVSYGVPP